MAKPIKLTKEFIEKSIEEFSASLHKARMTDGKLSYTKNFNYKEDAKAELLFTPTAFAKVTRLIMDFTSEIGWYGCGERVGDSSFLITDILVYPQKVTGTVVDFDPVDVSNWLYENREDERFDNVIMQGHSHVMMSTFASGVDLDHQAEILSQVREDGFYIFLIWNKKFEHNNKIYDLKNNILYEDSDITVKIVGEDTDLEAFMKEAKSVVKTFSYGNIYDRTADLSTPIYNGKIESIVSEKKFETLPKETGKYGSGYQNRGSEDMFDHFDPSLI